MSPLLPEASTLGRVLIVGANGRVGSQVLLGLKRRGAVTRPSYAKSPPNDIDDSWVQLDLLDSSCFSAALEGVDAMFMMRPPQMAKAKLIEPFLLAARRAGVSRLVFLSVKGADSNPILPHHGMERLIERLGFRWTHVRPSDFMQNIETEHLVSITQHNEIAVPAGSGKSAFIDVADVAEVIVQAFCADGHVGKGYTLTGLEALDFGDVAMTLSEVMGRTIRYRRVSLIGFISERRGQGVSLGLCLVMAALYTVQRLGLAAGTTETVANLLGRGPTDFATYAKRRFGADQ